ncbi:MAG: NAD-dependent epimerase/dehydratase family protein [Actinomycetota bacterium]|nr:NAD-dependent epimerase/dehydratase family protein [Actinomycetota bacterium]
MHVLVTGGAGFVGANLCVALAARHPDWRIAAFDNLKRRGSEVNLPRLREAGADFVHGDVRAPGDLAELGRFDAIVECSAEPSVMAGVEGSPDYLVQSNLVGAYHCLELARRDRAQLVFLSTSRVYPVAALERLAVHETETRFELDAEQPVAGASDRGIDERFPLEGARTLYGATKLAAELLIAEYAETYGLRAAVNRCGVIAGPWQMGKVDQGVFTHWMLSFYFRRPLAYFGYGGAGKQVRDLLHVDDLAELVDDQLQRPEAWAGTTFNVGGGRVGSLSLRETTDVCRELTGNDVAVSSVQETRAGDVRIFLSDCSALFAHAAWRPRRTPRDVLQDIFGWIHDNERTLRSILT